MTSSLKFPVSRWYIFSAWIVPIGVFLLTTLLLLFAKVESKDFRPIICFDILFFLLAIFGIKQFFTLAKNELAALELNDEEIIDHIFNTRVNWENVSDIRFSQGYGVYISIMLKDKKVPINQTKNIFKKVVFYINILFWGTPIRISPSYSKGINSEIFNEIYAYFNVMNLKSNIG